MASKHIAFIVKYFPTISETFIVNQINALIDKGYKVSLFSYQKTDETIIHHSIKKHQLAEKVNYFVRPNASKIKRLITALSWIIKNSKSIKWLLLFKSLNLFKYGKEAYTLKLFYELQWFLTVQDLDAIHVHFGMNAKRIAYLKDLGLLSEKLKLITTFHGYDLLPNKESYYKEYYEKVFRLSNAITVNTKYMESIVYRIKEDLKIVAILPVGLDTSYFVADRNNKRTNIFEIAFCGKLIPLKGADLVIKITKYLMNLGYNVRVNIVGDGQERNAIELLVKELSLLNVVTLHGNRSQEEIKNILNHSNVFLLPGRQDPKTKRMETQGVVIQEAQAMELPVIVSDVGGMKYGLINGETGFVVKEGDIVKFAECIEKLILDNDLREIMGKKGRDFVENNYDHIILVEKLLKIYNL